jgi:hypothetical protein
VLVVCACMEFLLQNADLEKLNATRQNWDYAKLFDKLWIWFICCA